MEINLGINSGMVHYHTPRHEWNWTASINQHPLCHDGVLVDS
jgi:hypothetical protein